MLKKSPGSDFNRYIRRFQGEYDDGTNIDLDEFMRNIVIKYDSLAEDGQWDINPKKMLRSLPSLVIFKNSRSYLLNS